MGIPHYKLLKYYLKKQVTGNELLLIAYIISHSRMDKTGVTIPEKRYDSKESLTKKLSLGRSTLRRVFINLEARGMLWVDPDDSAIKPFSLTVTRSEVDEFIYGDLAGCSKSTDTGSNRTPQNTAEGVQNEPLPVQNERGGCSKQTIKVTELKKQRKVTELKVTTAQNNLPAKTTPKPRPRPQVIYSDFLVEHASGWIDYINAIRPHQSRKPNAEKYQAALAKAQKNYKFSDFHMHELFKFIRSNEFWADKITPQTFFKKTRDGERNKLECVLSQLKRETFDNTSEGVIAKSKIQNRLKSKQEKADEDSTIELLGF